MGPVQSLNNTILGQSLQGKCFRTKVPFKMFCFKYDPNCYMTISTSDVEVPKIFNGSVAKFNMIIADPIEFTVLDIVKDWDTIMEDWSTGNQNIYLIIKLSKPIPLSNISEAKHYMYNRMIGVNAKDILNIDTSGNYQPPAEIRLTLDSPIGFIINKLPTGTYDRNSPAIIDTNILEEI